MPESWWLCSPDTFAEARRREQARMEASEFGKAKQLTNIDINGERADIADRYRARHKNGPAREVPYRS